MKRAVSLLLAVCLVAVLIVFGCTSAFASTQYEVTFSGLITKAPGDASYPESYMWTNDGKWAFRPGAQNLMYFSSPFQFQAGRWYTLNLDFEFIPGVVTPSVSYSFSVSLGDVSGTWTGIVSGTSSSADVRVLPSTYTFFCDTSFQSDGIYIELDGIGNDSTESYGQLGKILTITSESDGEHQSSIIGGKIDSAASNILSGEGLSGTSGVDDSPLSGTASGMAGAEGAIDDALGEGGLDGVASRIDAVMDVELNDSILASFSAINTLFTRIVDTLDLTIVLTFLLVFALAMYVVGRRVS